MIGALFRSGSAGVPPAKKQDTGSAGVPPAFIRPAGKTPVSLTNYKYDINISPNCLPVCQGCPAEMRRDHH